MNYQTRFNLEEAERHAQHISVKNWRVNYFAVRQKGCLSNIPLIFLGGAFQSLRSLRNEIAFFSQYFPTIVVDLPSQGENTQLAPELSLEDLADIFKQFLDIVDIRSIYIIGISYGSLLASLFTYYYPERVKRLVVNGVTTMARESALQHMKFSMTLLQEGKNKEFCHLVTSTLVNHFHRQETALSKAHYRLLKRKIEHLTENEKLRFLHNTARLISYKKIPGVPDTPLLVMVGEYDHFTMPHENALYAAKCKEAGLALILRADHLNAVEKMRAVHTTILRFLLENPLRSTAHIRYVTGNQLLDMEQRISPRYQITKDQDCIVQQGGTKTKGKLENINFFGFMVHLHEPLKVDKALATDLYIHACDSSYRFVILQRGPAFIRGCFLHTHETGTEALSNFLQHPQISEHIPE